MKKNQCQRILDKLNEHRGNFVSGKVFLRELFISQYHTRIFELQQQGFTIEPSDFVDEDGFKSYKLKGQFVQGKLFLNI